MRVALISGSYMPQQCGVSHYTQRLRRELTRHGIETSVLTSFSAEEATREARVIGAVRDWRANSLLGLCDGLHRLKPDIVHVQYAPGSYGFRRAIGWLPLALRAVGMRRPVVVTLHEYGRWSWRPTFLPRRAALACLDWGMRRGLWDDENGFLTTLADRVIATHSDTAVRLAARYPGLNARLVAIPIAPNIPVGDAPVSTGGEVEQVGFRSWLREESGWNREDAVISFFGFLHPVKGIETLLTAFRNVSRRMPEARLLLVGGVESLALPGQHAVVYSEALREQVRTLGLEGKVRMTGYIDEKAVSALLLGSDIGVLPFVSGVNLKSGSFLAMLAHGLPTVVTRADDATIAESDVSWVVPPRDHEALERALIVLLTHPELRARLASRGRRFGKAFSWFEIGRRHADLYRELR